MKKNLWQILASFMLILIVVSLVGPLRKFTNTQVEKQRDRILNTIEDNISVDIRYKSLSPSILQSLKIRFFSLASRQGNIKLEVERIQVFYSLKSLFSNEKKAEINRIFLAHGNIHIYSEESQNKMFDLDEILDTLTKNFGKSSLEMRDIQILVYSEKEIIKLYIDRFILDPKSDSSSLRLRSHVVIENLRGSGPEYVQFDLRTKGSLDNHYTQLSMDTILSKIQSDWFTMDEQRFHIGLGRDMFSLRKIKDQQPLDLEFMYNLDEKTLDFSWVSETFSPGSQITFHKNLNLINPWLDTDISGEAKIHYNMEDGSFVYDFDTQIVLDNEGIHTYIPEKTVITAVFQGSDKTVSIDQLMAETSLADFSYTGSVDLENKRPKGIFVINDYYLLSGETLDLVLSLDTFEELISIESLDFSIGDYSPGTWKLLLQPELEFKNIYISSQLNRNEEETLFFDGSVNYSKDWYVDGWFDFKQWNMEDLIPQISNIDKDNKSWLFWGQGLKLDSQGEFYWSLQRKMFFMEKLILDSPGQNPYHLESNFLWENGDISINQFYIDYQDYRLEAILNGRVAKKNIQSDIYINLGDYSYDMNLQYNSDSGLNINGNYGLSLALQKLSNNHFLLDFKTSDFPIDLHDFSVYSSFNIQGNMAPDNYALKIRNNAIKLFTKNKQIGTFAFSGILDHNVLDMYSLTWKDKFGTLQGNAAAHLGKPINSMGSLWVNLSADRSKESVISNLVWNPDGSLNGFLNWSGFELKRLEQASVEGTLNTEIQLTGSIRNPSLKGNTTGRVFYNNNEYNVSTQLHANEEIVELSDISIISNNLSVLGGFFFGDFSNQYFTFSSPVNANMGRKNFNSAINFIVESKEKDIVTAEMYLEPIVLNETSISPPIIFEGLLQDNILNISHQNKDIFSFIYNFNTKEILSSSKKLLPVSYELEGVLGQYRYLELSNFSSNIEWLNTILPQDALGRPILGVNEGLLHGNLSYRSEDQILDIQGQLTLEDLVLDTLYSYRNFSKSTIQMDFLGDHMILSPVSINVGDRGAVDLRGRMDWNRNNFGNLEIEGSARSLVPDGGLQFVTQVAGLNLDGEAEGDFRFISNSLENRFEGTFKANHLLLSLGEKAESKPKENLRNEKNLIIALNFVTGKDVRFVLPNEEFQFLEAKAAEDQELALYMEAGKKSFTFKGDLQIDQGEINYFQRSFLVNRGLIQFDENERSFNPRLEVSAEYITENDQNEPVVIYIDYDGLLIDDYEPVLSSMPTMESSRILSMLGQPIGVTSADNQEVISSIVLATGSMVGRYSLVVPFESALEDAFNLDKVSVNTALMENIILDQITSEGVFSNDNNQYNLMKYLDGSRLDMGKYLAKDLYFNGAIIVDSDNLNSGDQLGLDFSFSFEMATPFFDIGWNYQPDQFDSFNSDESFVSDTSITLKFIF